MSARASHWSSGSATTLLISLQLCAASANAAPSEPSSAPTLQAARGALSHLLLLGANADQRRGGQIAMARRQTETSRAKVTASWLDWLPDFSVAIRRQLEQETEVELNAPRWRFDLEGQLALTLPKLRATSTAQAAQKKAQAELEQTTYEARAHTLKLGFELYFAERNVELLRDQIGVLDSLGAETRAASGGRSAGDSVLFEGYLGELHGRLAALELEQRNSAQSLATTLDLPLTATGLDPRLDLPLLLELIRVELGQSTPRAARVGRAEIDLEEQRLRWTESQNWYVPELRSTTLAQLPQGNGAGSGGTSFYLTSVTTELALALRLRPELPALQSAQRQAIAKSRFGDENSRWERAQTAAEARARLQASSRLSLDEGRVLAARAELDDTARRFARGERSVAELANASRGLLAAQFSREGIVRDAVLAQIMLSTVDPTELALPKEPRREELAPSAVDRRTSEAADRAPLVRRARAEATRASERARSEGFQFGTALEAGLLLPLYETGDLALNGRPELTLSGTGSLTTPVRETSVLGRWSLDMRAAGPSRRAFESEARLRRAQAELERKRYQWAELDARLELAHARKALELSRRTAQFALDSLTREQRWLEQGAGSERDVRAAELLQHAATVEQGKAEERQQVAEVKLSSYLAAVPGTELTVTETPEAVERWSREHFLPDNGLLGFENMDMRHEAELEAESAHAQTESLAKPPRSTTLTAQATQGLRGGAFSLTFALSVALDLPRRAPEVTRAAEREGAARGRLAAFERQLEERRVRSRQRLAQASALLVTEATVQQHLKAFDSALRARQAATPELHEALKQRQLSSLELALLDSEKRALAADEQRRSAQLESLALGDTVPEAGQRGSAHLDETVRALIEPRVEVSAADMAAAEARGRQPVPGASALHLVGPFTVGSYDANRTVGPSTTKVWRSDIGAGVALGLDESLAFVATRELADAADFERVSARQKAGLRAIHELGRTWTARELERLSADAEAEMLHHLEASVLPRFALGQVTATTVVEAQKWSDLARLRHTSDETELHNQRGLLTVLGAKVSDAVLDEYQRRASAAVSLSMTTTEKMSGNRPDSAERAARSRSAAASTQVTASALRLVSPITGMVEFRPAQIETTNGTGEARETTTSHELLWVFSVIVPFKPKELGPLSVASAEARERDEEAAAATRAANSRWLTLRERLAASQKEQAGASARRVATERALAELDRRLHAAEAQTSIDEVAAARQTVFDARRAEVIAKGSTLEAALSLRAVQENR